VQRNGAWEGNRARLSTNVLGSRAAQRDTPVVLVARKGVRHWRKGKEGRDERWGERIEGKFEVEVKVGPLCPDRTTRGNGMVRGWGIERVSLRMYLDRERRNGPPPSSSSHATA